MERGCQVESKLKLMRFSASNEELYEVHRLIHDLSVPIAEVKMRLKSERRAPLEKRAGYEGIVRSVPSKNILYCSPPKCGTTNWQRGMQVLTDINKLKFLSPNERENNPTPKPEDYVPLQLFQQARSWPEFYATHNREGWDKIWAGRDPFRRIFSAWHDKTRSWRLEDHSIDYEAAASGTTWLWGRDFNTTDERDEHIRKQVNREDEGFRVYAKIMKKYQHGEVPYSQRFTWDAYTQYLADKANFAEEDNNHHWRTSTYQCGPCKVKYNIITHMEYAATDTAEVIDILKVSGQTHFGTFYTHGGSSESTEHWESVSKDVLRGIYRHYWLDFILLGYDLNDALRIISLGTD